MATDIARRSYDPWRHYRSVVSQQGRVSLEAEDNEDRVIALEERRHELIEIVGPAGTPDDGYAVSAAADPGDFTVGAGTMYVGGERVVLDRPVTYFDQPDWIDRSPELFSRKAFEHVVLLLTEHDVTAAEDPMLYEPALGGPDGAARVRIVQRIARVAVDADTCAGAMEEEEQSWAGVGLCFHPETMQLRSQSRLQVVWSGPPVPSDPCEPSAAQGYLGADNQMIRVQIDRIDRGGDGTFDLLWSWDDASALYPVDVSAAEPTVVTLRRPPVDSWHDPGPGQAVEVLRATAELLTTEIETPPEGYVAAHQGTTMVLGPGSYDPDSCTVTLPRAVQASDADPTQTPQLFLRVWQGLITGNKVDTPIELPGTGLSVTVTTEVAGEPVHPGDYWMIGVRPLQPSTVYPHRLLLAPQPPDGPRQWACPLALMEWTGRDLTWVADCRVHFVPLVDLGPTEGGCCTVSLTPEDAKGEGLQQAIDTAVGRRSAADSEHRVTVCLQPGLYELAAPLLLGPSHSYLTLEGCGDGATLQADPAARASFPHGLIVLVEAASVLISGLTLVLDPVSAEELGVEPASLELSAIQEPLSNLFSSLDVAFGIRPINCVDLTVTRCSFVFSNPQPPIGRDGADAPLNNRFMVGIFAALGAVGLNIEGNQFSSPVPATTEFRSRPITFSIGFLLAPTSVFEANADYVKGAAATGSTRASILDRAVIRDNTLDNLLLGVAVMAQLGEVRLEDNTVSDCYGGIILADLQSQTWVDVVGQRYVVSDADAAGATVLRDAVIAATFDPAVMAAGVLGRVYPLPDATPAPTGAAVPPAQTQQTWMQSFIDRELGAMHPAESPTAWPPDPSPGPPQAADDVAGSAFNQGVIDRDAFVATAVPDVLNLTNSHFVLSDFETTTSYYGVIDAPPTHGRLTIGHNRLEHTLQSEVSGTFSLICWADYWSTLVLDNNTMVGPVTWSTAMVLGFAAATVTGNIVVNNSQREATGTAWALLFLSASSMVALTGNVFFGPTWFPARLPAVPALPPWPTYNSVA
jgi:hypothetical protein